MWPSSRIVFEIYKEGSFIHSFSLSHPKRAYLFDFEMGNNVVAQRAPFNLDVRVQCVCVLMWGPTVCVCVVVVNSSVVGCCKSHTSHFDFSKMYHHSRLRMFVSLAQVSSNQEYPKVLIFCDMIISFLDRFLYWFKMFCFWFLVTLFIYVDILIPRIGTDLTTGLIVPAVTNQVLTKGNIAFGREVKDFKDHHVSLCSKAKSDTCRVLEQQQTKLFAIAKDHEETMAEIPW